MITPNKVVPLDSSVIGRIGHILKMGPRPVRVDDLFAEVGNHFESVDQFLLTLDVLYILDRIDVDFKLQKVIYAP
jgi:hypothetical protein